MIGVFAASEGSQLQVEGQDDKSASTPLETDPGSNRFYARICFTDTSPTTIKISDNPVSNFGF